MSFATSPKGPRLALVLASSVCAASLAGNPVPKPDEAPPPAAAGQPAAAPAGQPAPANAPVFRGDKPAPAADETKPASVPAPGALPVEKTEPDPNTPPQAAPPTASPAPGDLMGGQNPAAPSQNVTINLINRMVKKGLLTKEEAAELIQQAESDVAVARTQAQADAADAARAVVQDAVAQRIMPEVPIAPDDAVRVTYIPETVKKQIRDEIRQEVMAKAKSENWVEGKKQPEWVSRFRVKGDIRLRYEGIYFPDGNDTAGSFPNFNAINTGAPFDTAGTVFSPQLDADKDRNRFRIRARLGAEMDMGDNWTAGMRIATGETNTPTSTNQSLGLAAQGQGGNFSKYAIWLDRAFLKYESSTNADKLFTAVLGRADNPFFSTDLIYDEDLGFDGVFLTGRYKLNERVTPFAVAGAFPIFNTDLNFSSNQPAKFDSTDKYLYGAQVGTDVNFTKNTAFKIAGAYYYFDGAEGRQSTPFTPLTASDAGDTDNTRPSFAQKGNTYLPLRRIIPNANNNFGTTNQFQYYGLATKFQPLAITAKLDYNGFEPFQVSIIAEYIKNLGFDRSRLDTLGVNNRAQNSDGGNLGHFDGGDTAWTIGVRAGAAAFTKKGDWQVGFNYKHIESDSVIDGFNDSDFGLGGTNMEGYSVWGAVALSARTAISVRWVSTDEIAGPPLSIDTLFVDFGGRF